MVFMTILLLPPRLGITAGVYLILACRNIKFADPDSYQYYKEDHLIGWVVFEGCKAILLD